MAFPNFHECLGLTPDVIDGMRRRAEAAALRQAAKGLPVEPANARKTVDWALGESNVKARPPLPAGMAKIVQHVIEVALGYVDTGTHLNEQYPDRMQERLVALDRYVKSVEVSKRTSVVRTRRRRPQLR